MEFWFLAGLMTLAALFVLMRALSGDARHGLSAHAANTAHYQSQLQELERQQANGAIAPAEAEAARMESARRLIAAREPGGRQWDGDQQNRVRQAIAVFVLIAVPLIGAGVYARLGSPKLPDMPLEARRAAEPETFQALDGIHRMETHLFLNPGDGEGHEVLAPLYFRMGRYGDAAKAFKRAAEILGETPQRLASRGEALVAEAGGLVNGEALAVFDRVLQIEPRNGPARFYRATALRQDGRLDEAKTLLQTLLAETTEPDIRAMLEASLKAIATSSGSKTVNQ
jgi:cytochrome c-type biogenesis protein CcmH